MLQFYNYISFSHAGTSFVLRMTSSYCVLGALWPLCMKFQIHVKIRKGPESHGYGLLKAYRHMPNTKRFSEFATSKYL